MEQRFFSSTPFIRPAIVISIGVCLSVYFPAITWLITAILSLIVGLILYLPSSALKKYKYKTVFLLLALLSLLFTSAFRSRSTKELFEKNTSALFSVSSSNFVVKLTGDPANGKGFIKSYASIVSIIQDKECRSCNFPVLVYFDKPKDTSQLLYGSYLLIKGRPKAFQSPAYPGSFDAKFYYSRKGICASFYLLTNQYMFVNADTSSFMSKLHRFRMKCLGILKRNLHYDQSYRVSAAMLLGYASEVDPELMQAYSETGVIHILSVSGLHVGIFYIVLQRFLHLLFGGRVNVQRILTTLTSLPLIWGYTALTGFSAPAMRSALMISILIVGNTFSRNTYIWNSLFASYSVLLLIDGQFLFDPGFQLSFAALAALLNFQPLIISTLPLKNAFQRFCADWLSGSIAAQIGTLPFLLYYFRVFPLLFLPANLIMIPLGSLGLPAGMLALAAGLFLPTMISSWLFTPFEDLLRICNFLILLLHKLPFHALLTPSFSLYTCALLCIILYLMAYAVYSKNLTVLIPGFIAVQTCLFTMFLYQNISENCMVLPSQNAGLYSISNNKTIWFYCTEKILSSKDSLMIKTICKSKGLPYRNPIYVPGKSICIQYHNLKILMHPDKFTRSHSFDVIVNPVKTEQGVFTINDASTTFDTKTIFKSPEHGTLTINQITCNTSSLKPHWRTVYSAFRLTVLRKETRSVQKWLRSSNKRYAMQKKILK